MFVVSSYSLAVVLCFVTMLCWGSWGNTQKLAARSWRYELFYWDYVVGMVLFSLVLALTLGSCGNQGRSFLADLAQASPEAVGWILLGALVFNVSNILLSASTSLAGLSVAFPLGVGLALVVGVLNNLLLHPKAGTWIGVLLTGVGLVVAAVISGGMASARASSQRRDSARNRRGIILAALAGLIMSFFSALVYNGIDIEHLTSPAEGLVTPYTGMVLFAAGVFLSSIPVCSLVMRRPFMGEPVTYRQYFSGSLRTHLVGMLGGAIWCLGTQLNYVSAPQAGAAVSYALGQGAPMVAALWGVLVWKEYRGASRGTYGLLGAMFVLFILGLTMIIVSGA